jgi:hypothetical protein
MAGAAKTVTGIIVAPVSTQNCPTEVLLASGQAARKPGNRSGGGHRGAVFPNFGRPV